MASLQLADLVLKVTNVMVRNDYTTPEVKVLEATYTIGTEKSPIVSQVVSLQLTDEEKENTTIAGLDKLALEKIKTQHGI